MVLRLTLVVVCIALCLSFVGSCSPTSQCEGNTSYGTSDISTNGRPCSADCDCNNQKYEGYCFGNTCTSLTRLPCVDARVGEQRECVVPSQFRDKLACEKGQAGVRICKEGGLKTKLWGNCTCKTKGTTGKEPNGSDDKSTVESVKEEYTGTVTPDHDNHESIPDTPMQTPEGKQTETSPDVWECIPKTKMECYTGRQGTKGVGRCKSGEKVCQQDGMWGSCVGETLPRSTELCNHIDDDCNQKTDDIDCTGAFSSGSKNEDEGYAVAVDLNGNFFVTGYFSGTIVFGATTLTSQGKMDVFVTKMAPSGSFLWAKQAGGVETDRGFDVTTDSEGSAYIAGVFMPVASFGSYTLSYKTGQNMNGFLAKIDKHGTFLWVRSIDGESTDLGRGVALHPNHGVFITGNYNNFPNSSVTIGSNTYSSPGGSGLFVAALKTDGTWRWSTSAESKGFTTGQKIIAAEDGSSFLIGHFENFVSFGTTTLSVRGGRDVFVAKLDANGAWSWVEQAGSSQADLGYDLALDSLGHLYITGSFTDVAEFGTFILTSQGNEDIFVAKLTPQGKWVWAVRAGSKMSDTGYSIVVDSSGTAHVAGAFRDVAAFGSFSVTSGGADAIFIASLDAKGIWKNVQVAKGKSSGKALRLAVDPNGSLVATGFFGGSFIFPTRMLSSQGAKDIFVWRLTP